jgi:hypothetical protein
LDRADEAFCLAEFFKQNHILMFNSNQSAVLIKFWDLLVSLLIQVDQDSSRICCDIVFSLKKLNLANKGKNFFSVVYQKAVENSFDYLQMISTMSANFSRWP